MQGETFQLDVSVCMCVLFFLVTIVTALSVGYEKVLRFVQAHTVSVEQLPAVYCCSLFPFSQIITFTSLIFAEGKKKHVKEIIKIVQIVSTILRAR